jgi:antitoxin (DNA-binding transcriptional repressor) of toxin-antitoxin stability system
MEMSIREAKAKFSEAIAAVERGELITVTKYGQPVATIGKPQRKGGLDFAAADRLLKERGLDTVKVQIPHYFDDPAYSRKLLGLDG